MSSLALDIFEPAPVVEDIIKREWIEYKPVAPVHENCCIEFNINPSPAQYLDLKRSQLQVKISIVKEDGTPFTAAEMKDTDDPLLVGPANLLLSSMFCQLDVALQQLIVTSSVGNNFPYKSMIDVLVDEGGMKGGGSYLPAEGYVTEFNHDNFAQNPLVFAYGGKYVDGNIVHLQGSVRMDICSLSKLIPNGVSVKMKYYQSKDPFRIMTTSNNKFKLILKDASLKVCHVTLSDMELLRQTDSFSKSPAVYDFYRSDVRCFQLSKGTYTSQFENFYNGDVPTEIIMGFVKSEAYSGSYQTNPMVFRHFDINHLEVSLDGISVPTPALKPNFGIGDYADSYLRLFKDDEDQNLAIEYTSFPEGNTLFRFDLQSHVSKHSFTKPRRGNLRVSVSFANPLSEEVSWVLYGRFPARITIDQARNVMQA